MINRKFIIAISGILISISAAATVYAGTWQTDANGWWYSNDDGTWPDASWQWIDGDVDGISECYYFDANGYCLMDTTTPDGSQVNQNGAWIEFGKVRTKTSGSVKEDFTLSSSQREIMQKVLENVIPSVPDFLPDKTENLTSDNISHILYGHLNSEMYDDLSGSDSNLVCGFYTEALDSGRRYFAKYKVFKRIEDLYGHPVKEDMLTIRDFQIDDTTISIGGADGDGVTDAIITDYHLAGGKLYLNVHYTVTYNVSELDTSGDLTAVFTENPNSFIGFTLESVNKN